MGLIYKIKHWVDHVVEFPNRYRITDNGDGTVTEEKEPGEIIRQGTARNATNYNNMETGIFSNSIFGTFLMQMLLQKGRSIDDLKGETAELTITNNNKYPFSSNALTVALKQKRSSDKYYVRCDIENETGGFVEEIEVFDKQLNGFKIRFKGSARSAKIKYYVIGGLYQQ